MNIKAKNIEAGMVINDDGSQRLVISKIIKNNKIEVSSITTLLSFQFPTNEVLKEDDLVEIPFEIGSKEYLACVEGMLQTALMSLAATESNIKIFRKMVSCD